MCSPPKQSETYWSISARAPRRFARENPRERKTNVSGRQKILIVDDKLDNLRALEATLKETNAEIVEAQNGNDALIASLNHDFALAILDVQMPVMDGYELAGHLRNENQTRHIPIVFLTAYADEQEMFKGYGIGAMDYIVKPYDPVILLSKVLAFLELHRQRAEIQRQTNRLEGVVEERTAELKRVNERLMTEIADRSRAEEEVRKLNEDLELLVSERTRQLEAVNKELEAFAYSVSHDLRAPLRAVEGFSQALLEDYRAALDGRGQDYLRRVSGEARRMAQLIQDLLVLSRVTRAEMNLQRVELSALAQEVIKMLRQGEPARRVNVAIQDGMTVQGDSRLLRQVLENLLGNAWKFTSRREGGRIELGAHRQDGIMTYFVRDNGAGFDMEYADKLFVPFQRLHGMNEFPGTGVGLSTVQRIISRHGGRAWAEGKVGEGATFYFTLGDTSRAEENR
jgi:two-component system, sensor histidine kinase and response regulator